MMYKCSRCNYEAVEYSCENHSCPNCGESKLFFLHIGFNGRPNHEVLIDTNTGKLLSADPCDYIGKQDANILKGIIE